MPSRLFATALIQGCQVPLGPPKMMVAGVVKVAGGLFTGSRTTRTHARDWPPETWMRRLVYARMVLALFVLTTVLIPFLVILLRADHVIPLEHICLVAPLCKCSKLSGRLTLCKGRRKGCGERPLISNAIRLSKFSSPLSRGMSTIAISRTVHATMKVDRSLCSRMVALKEFMPWN